METTGKIPIQVRLSPEQVQELEEVAARWQVSLEDVVRQSVGSLLFNLYVTQEPPEQADGPDPFEAFVGLGHSGVGDLAEHHDKYLMEFEEQSRLPASGGLAMQTLMKEPLPVYLRQDQFDTLQVLAREWDIPVDELIRQSVDALLAEGSAEDNPLRDIIGMFHSGVGDLAENHDHYIAQFVYEESHPCPEQSS